MKMSSVDTRAGVNSYRRDSICADAEIPMIKTRQPLRSDHKVIKWAIDVVYDKSCMGAVSRQSQSGPPAESIYKRNQKDPHKPLEGSRRSIGILPVLVFELFGLGGHSMLGRYAFWGGGAI